MQDPVLAILVAARIRGEGVRPTGQMTAWPQGYGCHDHVLGVREVAKWEVVRRREALVRSRSRLRCWEMGETVRRKPQARGIGIGRQMYRGSAGRVQSCDQEGREMTSNADAEALMWRHRSGIWASSPAIPAGAATLLSVLPRPAGGHPH